MTTISARDFNQNTAEAKRLALAGPLVVTDRGVPAFVLTTYEEYCRLSGSGNIVALLSRTPEVGDIEFEPHPVPGAGRAAEFD